MRTPRRVALSAFAFLVLAVTSTLPAFGQEIRPLDRTPPRPPETATEPQGFLREPDAIQRIVIFGDRRLGNGELKPGWYIDRGDMIPGAGWLSVGPGYRRWSGNGSMLLDGSAAISWHGYKTAQARIEFPELLRSRFLVGSQIRWQDYPRVAYFGEGPASSKANRSEYGFQSTNIIGYATFRPVRWFGIGANVGWLKPSIDSRGGFFKGDTPETQLLFASDPVFTVDDD